MIITLLIREFRMAAAVAIVAVVLGAPLIAAENMWSVQKLNDNQPWDTFVGSPIPIKIEGRLGTYGGGQFRLMKCEVKFTIDGDKLKQLGSKPNVEVKGRFKKNNGKIEFAVDDLRVVPSFPEQFEIKASKLKLPTIEEWIELGDWGMERGRFYEDDELIKKAKKAYGNAIELEYKSPKFADADGRFALAKKVELYQLSDRWRMELVHDGLRIQWKGLLKTDPLDPAQWQQFAEQLNSRLPGANEHLRSIAPELKEAYEREPDPTYQNAKDDVRRELHRLFFIAVTRKILLFGISDDGRDGDTVAARIDKVIPEEHTTAESLRIANLGYRAANVAVATRAEVESLAIALRERRKDEQADQVLSKWIKSHESRLKGDGIVGLVQLSDEYLSLLNDEQMAVDCLIEAHRIDPKFEDVITKLTSLGYHLKNGRWSKGRGQKADVPAPDSQSPTGISLGMTATNLRTLLGQPRSLSRAITARGSMEVWSFGPVGSSQLVVRLEQKGRDGELKVTAFTGQ